MARELQVMIMIIIILLLLLNSANLMSQKKLQSLFNKLGSSYLE